MALVIPNIESITNGTNGFDCQTVADATDWNAEALALEGAGYVVSGMTVSQDTGSDMKIAIASGSFVINGILYTYAGSGGSPITVAAADASDRRDIVSINSTGTITVTKGTDCGTAGWTRSSTGLPPVKPTIPSNNCILGEIYVGSSTTAIANINIVDKTVVRIDGNYDAVSLATAVTLPTSTATNTAVLTTDVLGVGTWMINAQMLAQFGTSTNADGQIIFMSAGSATATFIGPTSAENGKFLSSSYGQFDLCTIAQITSAGTLIMYASGSTAATAVTQDFGLKGHPTGIISVRIA